MLPETKTIGGFEFWMVGQLQLRRSATGQIEEYSHLLSEEIRTNAHAAGPFCYFSLPQAPRSLGVYAIFVGGNLKYIGECQDLAGRFSSTGYGQISPRNLHHDGQSTNCKLNSRVLEAAKQGHITEIWFHPTDDRKAMESRLISELFPEWNGREPRSVSGTAIKQTRKPLQSVRAEGRSMSSEDFRTALSELLAARECEGASTAIVQAGELHRAVGGYPGNHRMPVCCAVMRSFMCPDDRILYEPPKRNGARLEIEYRLPRASMM